MEHHVFISKAIHSQKTASDHFFALLSVAQSNSEDLLKITLDQCTWLPDSGKKSCLYWNDYYLKTTESVKKFIDMGYLEVEKAFSGPAQENQPKSSTKITQKKASAAAPKRKGNRSAVSSGSTTSPGESAPASAASESAPGSQLTAGPDLAVQKIDTVPPRDKTDTKPPVDTEKRKSGKKPAAS